MSWTRQTSSSSQSDSTPGQPDTSLGETDKQPVFTHSQPNSANNVSQIYAEPQLSSANSVSQEDAEHSSAMNVQQLEARTSALRAAINLHVQQSKRKASSESDSAQPAKKIK